MTPLEEKHLNALSDAHAPMPEPTPPPLDTLDMQYNATDKYPTPCRESAASIAERLMREHERELLGWTYLREALQRIEPTPEAEEALYEMFNRMRRF